jgi:hypothetical protein
VSWLRSARSFLSPDAVAQVLDLLKSDQTDEQISALLLEILGYEHIEEVSRLLAQRPDIKQDGLPKANGGHLNGHDASFPDTSEGPTPVSRTPQPYVPRAQLVFRDAQQETAARKAQQDARKAARAHPIAGQWLGDCPDLC